MKVIQHAMFDSTILYTCRNAIESTKGKTGVKGNGKSSGEH